MASLFRRLFRREQQQPSTLECIIDGKPQVCRVVQASGLRLMVATNSGAHLISETQAVNKAVFWRIWTALSPKVTWEDGTPFVPQ